MTDTEESAGTQTLRRILLWIMAATIVGTTIELALLGHTETATQWIPFAAFTAGAIGLAGVMVRPTHSMLRALQAAMIVILLAGVAGLYFHLVGNMEFARETYPAMAGAELFREAVTGATPTLAPGAMVQLGLLGLAYCYRHPALLGRRHSN